MADNSNLGQISQHPSKGHRRVVSSIVSYMKPVINTNLESNHMISLQTPTTATPMNSSLVQHFRFTRG